MKATRRGARPRDLADMLAALLKSPVDEQDG
jgi:hypothetical protein